MKNIVRQITSLGRCRLLFFFCACLFFMTAGSSALAASWSWQALTGREQIDIDLGAIMDAGEIERLSERVILIPLDTQLNNLLQQGSPLSAEALVESLRVTPKGLEITMKDGGFGYIFAPKEAQNIVFTVFVDVLAKRLRPFQALPAPVEIKPLPQTTLAEQEQPTAVIATKAPVNFTVRQIAPRGKVVPAPKQSSLLQTIPTIIPRGLESARNTLPSEAALRALTTKILTVLDDATSVKEAMAAETPILPTTPDTTPTTTPPTTPPSTPLQPEAPASTPLTEGNPVLPQNPRGRALSSTELRGTLNTEGPSAWPKSEGLHSGDAGFRTDDGLRFEDTIAPAETPLPVGAEGTQATSAPPAPAPSIETTLSEDIPYVPPPSQEVLYLDEDGNPTAKPVDFDIPIDMAIELNRAGKSQEVLDTLEPLRTVALNPSQRERMLYTIADVYYRFARNDSLTYFDDATRALHEAMNNNLNSVRVPEILIRLGLLNLHSDNQEGAQGYFGALQTKYPKHPSIPEMYLLLGQDMFEKEQYGDAAEQFQKILTDYSTSDSIRDASLQMTRSLYQQGHMGRALVLLDFMDRRWPRMYTEYPDYLPMLADVEFREDRYKDALKTYFKYVNISPDGKDVPLALLRMGNIYLYLDLLDGARKMFEHLIRDYPDANTVPRALLRLGEEGIFDGNYTVDEIIALFERDSPAQPDMYYRKILDEFPDSLETERATLRLLIWEYWQNELPSSIQRAQAFLKKYPTSPLFERAQEVLDRAFERQLTLALGEENFERVLSLWETVPEGHRKHLPLSDDLRVAMAKGTLNRGQEPEAMALLAPFLDREMDDKYGEYAYNLFLSMYLRQAAWANILELGGKVENWPLPIETRGQLLYAMAISAQNLNDTKQALDLWTELYAREDLAPYQKAYASYFMARKAESERDLVEAYRLNLETLQRFSELQNAKSDKADPERVRETIASLMDVTEVAGRYAESLDWLRQYDVFVPQASPDYSGLRFREARLERKMGNTAKWRALLENIVSSEPSSVFGQMASSELRTHAVARDLERFTEAPPPPPPVAQPPPPAS